MRQLFIGILVFLIWMALATWYYTANIYPRLHLGEETQTAGTVPEITETPPETPPAPPQDITFYFDFDKTVILNTADLQEYLPESLDYLEADSLASMQIVGHTCDIGTAAYNMNLGMRRAMALQSYLLSKGISRESMMVSSKGEAEPAVVNTNEENRKRNRRVEVHIHH